MTNDYRKLKLCLSIISGRNSYFDDDDFNTLGYDVYKFGYYGKPSHDEIKSKAEDIIIEMILKGKDDE